MVPRLCCGKSPFDELLLEIAPRDRSEEFADRVSRALQPFEVNESLPEILHFSYTFGRLGQLEP